MDAGRGGAEGKRRRMGRGKGKKWNRKGKGKGFGLKPLNKKILAAFLTIRSSFVGEAVRHL